MPKKTKSFEEKFSILENIIEELEENEINLDKLLKKHDEANTLIKELQVELEEAKQKLYIVNTQNESIEEENSV